mmetsp:Transcript_20480/g.42179  ORF Transcript_20480/g.42179 Transcript_20480/m.42179 type:complete len:227 (+) Transcript_20480:77-757(+)
MAAILCKTLGELISKCCECIKLPCQYLGQACGKSCDLLGDVMCTPFAPYLIVTLALNTPAVVYAIKAIEGYDCSPSLVRWLVINGAFGLCHMVAAFYITSIIRTPAPQNDAPTISATTGLNSPQAAAEEGRYQSNFRPLSEGTEIPGGANSFQRIKHVLCYDKGMAIYILVFLIWICWTGMGVVRRLQEGDNCYEMTSHMTTTIVCGYVWMSLVGAAFCCSLLCLR